MEVINLIGKKDGNLLRIANGGYRIILSGKQTEGKYAVIEMNVPPGAGPGPHSHKDIEEVFFVSAGELDFRSENGVYKAKAGDMIRIPAGGAVHAFKNNSASEATLICTVYPAGLEVMFTEVSAADPSLAKEIAEKYGNQIYASDYLDERPQ
jgi:quercetin dioxygenase-like cupin family protein